MTILYSIPTWLDTYPKETERASLNPRYTCVVVVVGGPPGINTCRAKCSHCFLGRKRRLDAQCELTHLDSRITKEEQLIHDLKRQGYYIVPMIADTFAWNGAYLERHIIEGSPLYDDQQSLEQVGVAWTSGLPLLGKDTDHLLMLGAESGHTMLSITCYGIGENETPFQGVPHPSRIRDATMRVHDFNDRYEYAKYTLCMTFTVGTYSIARLDDYIDYARDIGCHYIRFNRFIDFSLDGRYQKFMLSEYDNKQFFRWIDKISGCSKEFPKVMISTDFGFSGSNVLELPYRINHCPGGRYLFCISDGLVYPCNECLSFAVGRLIESNGVYSIILDKERMDVINAQLSSPSFDGCIGYSLSKARLLTEETETI